MKKIIIAITFILTFSCMTSIIDAEGYNKTFDSDYVQELTETKTSNLVGGATVSKQQVKSVYDGINFKEDGINAIWHPNTVQWADIPSTINDGKIVTWSQGTIHGFDASTVRSTAKDYEQSHPGWIVVAAMNADFFAINDTQEPLNFHMQEGNLLQPRIIGGDHSALGWTQDGKVLAGVPTIEEHMTLQIFDKGKIASEIAIQAVNDTPSETGISLITKDSRNKVDLTGYTVYIGNYDLCRISLYNKRVFVSGKISSIDTSLAENSIPALNEFYLVSKDGSLDGLSTDTYVKCQHKVTGEFAGIESGTGYVIKILENGTPLWRANSIKGGDKFDYKSSTHPRALIGFRDNGSTVMMVANGRGKESDCNIGMSVFQGADMLRQLGCTEAYNLDGGGSATLIVRNSYGNFDVINTPSDGSERGIGNAILYVMRDPGFKIDYNNVTRNSVKIDLTDTLISKELKNIVVKCNGKSYPFSDKSIVIDKLTENTEYQFEIEYDIYASYDKNVTKRGKYLLTVSTKAFEMPNPGLEVSKVTDTTILITKKDYSTSSWIKDVVVHVGDETYMMNDLNSFTITGLFKDTEYKVFFEYNVEDPDTKNLYAGVTNEIVVSTLSFTVPIITQFEESRVNEDEYTFRYRYKDEDKVCTKAYVLVNDTKYELDASSGTVTVKLNRYENSYVVKLILEYNAAEEIYQVESDSLNYDLVEKPVEKGCKKSSPSLFLSSLSVLSLALYILKKKH